VGAGGVDPVVIRLVEGIDRVVMWLLEAMASFRSDVGIVRIPRTATGSFRQLLSSFTISSAVNTRVCVWNRVKRISVLIPGSVSFGQSHGRDLEVDSTIPGPQTHKDGRRTNNPELQVGRNLVPADVE